MDSIAAGRWIPRSAFSWARFALVAAFFLWAAPFGARWILPVVLALCAAIEHHHHRHCRCETRDTGGTAATTAAGRSGKLGADRIFSRHECARLIWGAAHRDGAPDDRSWNEAIAGGPAGRTVGARREPPRRTRFFESLVVWGLKTGLEKFSEGVGSAAKAQGAATANAGIGWAMGAVFGIDLNGPDQQAITNERLVAIEEKLDVLSSTLERHTEQLQSIETKLDGTTRILTGFLNEYRDDRTVQAYVTRADQLHQSRVRIKNYSDRLQNLMLDAAHDLDRARAGVRRPTATATATAAAVSDEVLYNLQQLRDDINSNISLDFDLLLASVTGNGGAVGSPSARPSLLQLFADAYTAATHTRGVYPRFLAPNTLDALWVHYYSLWGPFVEAANLLVEASHIGVRPHQTVATKPSLVARIDRGFAEFERQRALHLPAYVPLPDDANAFWIDPTGGRTGRSYALTAAPVGGDRTWTAEQAQQYLATARLGGLERWHLPSSDQFSAILGEARQRGIQGADGGGGAWSLMQTLGFRLMWENPQRTKGGLAVSFLTSDGWFKISDDSTLGERFTSRPTTPIHLLAWHDVAPNV